MSIRHLAAAALFAFVLLSCRNEVTNVVEPALRLAPSLVALNGNRSVTLGWDSLSDPAVAEIQIHRSDDAAFPPTSRSVIASLPASATHYTDTGLVNGARYYYRLVPVEERTGGVRQPWFSEESTPARPFDYASVDTIRFSEHILPIFQSGCAVHGCHAAAEPVEHSAVFAKAAHTGQIPLASWEDLFNGSAHGELIVPFRGDKSHLVYHINTDTTLAPVSQPHMPNVKGMDLPADQVRLLMRWIDNGAQDDNGALAYSVNPAGKVLATNQAEDVVAVIDIRTGFVTRYVRAGWERVVPPLQPQSPHNLTVDPAHGVYFVNLVTSGKVLKFSLSDNAPLGEVSGIQSPTQVALSATGDTGYVAQFNENAHAIRLFNTRTMQLYPDAIGSVALLSKPHGVQRTPDGKSVVITGNFSDNLIVYDIATGGIGVVWLDPASPVPSSLLKPYQTVMTRDNRYIYVTCQASSDVRKVDRDSMKVVKVIPVGKTPIIADITPDGRFVVVANRDSNSVSVISTESDAVVATIGRVGPGPHGVAIDRDGRFAYVTCENVAGSGPPPHHPTEGSKAPGYVAVIDLSTYSVVKTIEVANFAAGVAVVQ